MPLRRGPLRGPIPGGVGRGKSSTLPAWKVAELKKEEKKLVANTLEDQTREKHKKLQASRSKSSNNRHRSKERQRSRRNTRNKSDKDGRRHHRRHNRGRGRSRSRSRSDRSKRHSRPRSRSVSSSASRSSRASSASRSGSSSSGSRSSSRSYSSRRRSRSYERSRSRSRNHDRRHRSRSSRSRGRSHNRDRRHKISRNSPSSSHVDRYSNTSSSFRDKEFRVGDICKGVVKDVKTYGCFISVSGHRQDGMVHVSQVDNSKVSFSIVLMCMFSDIIACYVLILFDSVENLGLMRLTMFILKPYPDGYRFGDSVWVKVVRIDEPAQPHGRKKIAMSMKVVSQTDGQDLGLSTEDSGGLKRGASDIPRSHFRGVGKVLELHSIHKGRIRTIKPFGCFVCVPGYQDGMVHISQIASQRVRN